MKTVWLSSLLDSEAQVKSVMAQLNRFGLDVKGHFWKNDRQEDEWLQVREELLNPKVGLWAILATAKELESPPVRYGLSLTAIAVQAQKGYGFPIILLSEGDVVRQSLPFPLREAELLSVAGPRFEAKLVAGMHTPRKRVPPEYRLDIIANRHIGQWFEVGPQNGTWDGAMFGIAGGEIAFHAVGPRGKLPDSTVLNFAVKGLKLMLGEEEYTAWAVQNPLDSELSYFVKVEGTPGKIIFGAFPREEQAEVFAIDLK